MGLNETDHLLHGHSDPAVDGRGNYQPTKRVLLVELPADQAVSTEALKAWKDGQYDDVEIIRADEREDEGPLIVAP